MKHDIYCYKKLELAWMVGFDDCRTVIIKLLRLSSNNRFKYRNDIFLSYIITMKE